MVLTRIEEYGSRPTEECHWAACCIYLVHTCILQQQQYCLLLCLPGWNIYTVRIWSRDRWWCCLSEVWLHSTTDSATAAAAVSTKSVIKRQRKRHLRLSSFGCPQRYNGNECGVCFGTTPTADSTAIILQRKGMGGVRTRDGGCDRWRVESHHVVCVAKKGVGWSRHVYTYVCMYVGFLGFPPPS